MPITFPLALPTVGGPRQIAMRTRSAVGQTVSPFTGQRQVQVHAAQFWEADISLAPMVRADAEAWIAFLVSLNGVEGTFLLGDSAGPVPRGSAATAPGTPVIMGGAQTGGSLVVDGLPALATGYLLAGDYIQLGTGAAARLHKVLVDADSDAGGVATLDIWPNIGASPVDNDPVAVGDAKGAFSLVSNVQQWDVQEALIYGIAFAAVSIV